MTESPSANHAVSEKGMYMLRNTTANSTENVTVPISWYLPKRYLGSFSVRIILYVQVLVKTNVCIFAPNNKKINDECLWCRICFQSIFIKMVKRVTISKKFINLQSFNLAYL